MGPGILRTQGIQSRIRGHGSFLSKRQLALLNLNTYVRRVCFKVYAKCLQQDNATKRSGGMLEHILALACRLCENTCGVLWTYSQCKGVSTPYLSSGLLELWSHHIDYIFGSSLHVSEDPIIVHRSLRPANYYGRETHLGEWISDRRTGPYLESSTRPRTNDTAFRHI